MGLEKYKQKRTFSKTPEPTGGRSSGDKLRFVIQKHAASHLHYDFRLEMRGVLKSWAVPKGPSTDPQVKRLAMMVEDHPYDYRTFEGIIPKGQYGGGTVIVWDEGTYETEIADGDKKAQEKELLKQLYSGKLNLTLYGKKLKGQYALVKASNRGENSWLLMKVKDKYAAKTDVTKKDKSVLSGKTIEAVAGNPNVEVWQSNRKEKTGATKKDVMDDLKAQLLKGRKAPMPSKVLPMLCTLTKQPIDDPEYLYELKWDGYRIISYVSGKKIRMDSRSALDYTKKYPPIADALRDLKHKVVLDGEVVVFNEDGKPDFDALQKYNGHTTAISYCVFDLLWLDGYDLTGLPLTGRKEILRSILPESETLRFSESFDSGAVLYEQTQQLGLEGIVAKRRDSTYQQNIRGNDWLKTPTRIRQEFVIGGWAESDKARLFKSLLFGAYNPKGEFEWIGRSGGGYKEKDMPAIMDRLKKLEIEESPFVNKVLDTKGAKIRWVKPQLVANFEFATWTKTGRIRKPATFLGFRKDKKAKDVVREVPKPVDDIQDEIQDSVEKVTPSTDKTRQPKPTGKLKTDKGSNWLTLEGIEHQMIDEIELADCTVPLYDVDRELWPNVPKARLIEYYHEISHYILPHIKNRPLSLHVKPNGAMAPGLYIKDMEGRQPDCADIFTDKRRHPKPGKRNSIGYLVCNNEATLLYLINLGCIDINPWMSRVDNPTQPDFLNIDLDPSDDNFNKVIETALAAKKLLQKLKIKSFVKTSGKTGLHIYIPVTGIDYKEARDLSERLGKAIHEMVPDITTTNVNIRSRGNKVFIDPSQNDYADTLACVYSVRPNVLPTVSTPLDWREVKKGLDPRKFTIDTVPARIKKKGDLFADSVNSRWKRSNMTALNKLNL